MKNLILKLAFVVLALAPALKAESALQCTSLFSKSFKTTDFSIHVEGKKQSDQFLNLAHAELVANDDPARLTSILEAIVDQGFNSISTDDRNFIITFRQNSSLLRSIFQTSDKTHVSPEKFGKFVRDLGILKDFLLMNDAAQTEEKAQQILNKYSTLDFNEILKDARPASKKSVRKYFQRIIGETIQIMDQSVMTIDEVHEVRKNLRDILRYLQLQQQVMLTRNIQPTDEMMAATSFLKKTNTKLGAICDDYAAQILKDKDKLKPKNERITKKTMVAFPAELRPRVENFLNNYEILLPIE
jgi:hypothetical protein